jgi:hypothetical protein
MVAGPLSGQTYSCTWVGIDGYNNKTVEQIGTEQDWINGSPVYYAWWEMASVGLHQPQQLIPTMTVHPGDLISAAVQYIPITNTVGLFGLFIDDQSQANDSFGTYQSSSQTQSPLAQRTSAEWIVEATSVNNTTSLANFGSVTLPKPSRNVSRSRVVMGRLAGTVSSSGPSIRVRTFRFASSGKSRSTGSGAWFRPSTTAWR